MSKSRQFYHCLILIFFILIFFGCEKTSQVLDIDDNGLFLDIVSLSDFNTQTEQRDILSIGDSFKLYVGSIDPNRNSQILININLELLQNSLICDSILTDSVFSSYLELISTSEFYFEEQHDTLETGNSTLGKEIDSNQFEAFYLPNQNFINNWYGDSIIYQEELFNLDNINNIQLNISILNSSLKIHLDNIFSNDILCKNDESIYILLRDSKNQHLTEFFSSEFNSVTYAPKIYTERLFTLMEINELNKINIESVSSEVLDTFYTEYDLDQNKTGIFRNAYFNYINDFPDIISEQDTPIDTVLFKLDIQLENIESDNSSTIDIFLNNLYFSNLRYNSVVDSLEGDFLCNIGEYFEDCGIDQICDENEWYISSIGDTMWYRPEGTENNLIWDLNEIFQDCGLDSLCDEDEDNFDIINNPDPAADNFNPDPNRDNTTLIDSVNCINEYYTEGNNIDFWLTKENLIINSLELWCGQLPNNYCFSCDTLIFLALDISAI